MAGPREGVDAAEIVQHFVAGGIDRPAHRLALSGVTFRQMRGNFFGLPRVDIKLSPPDRVMKGEEDCR